MNDAYSQPAGVRSKCLWAGLALGLALSCPPVRQATEWSMQRQMLLQFPLWMLAGALLATCLPQRATAAVREFDQVGATGLVWSGLSWSLLMIPRLLDRAVLDARIDALKFALLASTGAALSLSWKRAGVVLQGFFVGNVAPMMVVAGTVYQEADVRLCSVYRLDDQQSLGKSLVWLACLATCIWILSWSASWWRSRVGWSIASGEQHSPVERIGMHAVAPHATRPSPLKTVRTRQKRTDFKMSLIREPGKPVDLRRLHCATEDTRSHALYKSTTLEVVLLHLADGKDLLGHYAKGDVTIQCLEGRVAVALSGHRVLLEAGTMICLGQDELHGLTALQASYLLVTFRLAEGR